MIEASLRGGVASPLIYGEIKMSFTNQLKKTTLRTAFGFLEKNPEENALKLMSWVDKLAGDGPDSFPVHRAAVRRVLEDPQNNMYQLAMSILKAWMAVLAGLGAINSLYLYDRYRRKNDKMP